MKYRNTRNLLLFQSSTKEELEALQKESEVPLEDLLKTLPDEDELAEEEVRKHYLHKMCY